MRLKLSNIGIIESADVEIESITVITGANNSGKSTIGKVIYSVSTVQNMISNKSILLNKYRSILNELNGLSRWINDSEYMDIYNEAREILGDINRIVHRGLKYEEVMQDSSVEEQYELLDEKLKLITDKIDIIELDFPDNKNIKIAKKNLDERILKSENDDSIKILTLEDILSNEFSGNFLSENSVEGDASIELLEDNKDTVNFYMNDRKIDFDKSTFHTTREYSESIYFDDPFLLDDPFAMPMGMIGRRKTNSHLYGYKHRRNMLTQLNRATIQRNFFDESIQNEHIQTIFSTVLEGEVKRGNSGYVYSSSQFSNDISFDSLSAGMKSFSTMQMLMEYGLLNNTEYLILDEPETHLHPEWQVRFAELVVLISMHYPVRILVTSHSPYFIEALDIFSRKYKIEKGVKFYNSISKTNLGSCKIVEVTDNLETIFKDMYKPLNYLAELREEIEN